MRNGFTLLEVCVAITIGLLMIGAATLGISSVGAEHRLRRLASSIETTARESLLRAVSQQRNVFLEVNANGLALSAANARTETLETGGTLEILRYGEKSYRAPRRGELWRFSADGVCEPLSLRITLQQGFIEMSFDPLTGCARKKSIIVQG